MNRWVYWKTAVLNMHLRTQQDEDLFLQGQRDRLVADYAKLLELIRQEALRAKISVPLLVYTSLHTKNMSDNSREQPARGKAFPQYVNADTEGRIKSMFNIVVPGERSRA